MLPVSNVIDAHRPNASSRGLPLVRGAVSAWVGISAIAFSGLYFASDVIEATQDGFSTPQLLLTLVAEAAIPLLVIGLWAVQRPSVGALGFVGALAYAYSYVFFTGTVVYALVTSTADFETLSDDLGILMSIHGAVMLVSGVAFGVATARARVLPRWTGWTLVAGVILVTASSFGAPTALQTASAGVRDMAFVGMGAALLTASSRRAPR